MTLSDGQLTALRNLAAKKGGSAVDWINIADARRLTELGLAERNREGWNITDAGAAWLAEDPDTVTAPEETTGYTEAP